VKGTYNRNTDTSNLKLKPKGAAKGSSIKLSKVKVSGSDLDGIIRYDIFGQGLRLVVTGSTAGF
jgi:hypothetical protein